MKKGLSFALAVIILLLMLAFSAFGVIRIVDLVVTAHMRRTGGLRMAMYEQASMYNLINSVPEDIELIHEYNKFCTYEKSGWVNCSDFKIISMNLVLIFNNLTKEAGKKSIGAGGALIEFFHPECPDACPDCICKVMRQFPVNLYDYYGDRLLAEESWILPTKYGTKFRKSSFIWQSDFADVSDELTDKLVSREAGLESIAVRLRDYCVKGTCNFCMTDDECRNVNQLYEFILFPYSKINYTDTKICEYSCFNSSTFLDESQMNDACASWYETVCFDISDFKTTPEGICKDANFAIYKMCSGECIGKTIFNVEEPGELEHVWSEGLNEFYFKKIAITDSNKFKLTIKCDLSTKNMNVIISENV